jgi:hypothetical protein
MDNSSYSYKDYSDKRGFGSLPTDKPCYYNAALLSEREIATTYEEWDPASVRERLAKLEKWRWSDGRSRPPWFRTTPTTSTTIGTSKAKDAFEPIETPEG